MRLWCLSALCCAACAGPVAPSVLIGPVVGVTPLLLLYVDTGQPAAGYTIGVYSQTMTGEYQTGPDGRLKLSGQCGSSVTVRTLATTGYALVPSTQSVPTCAVLVTLRLQRVTGPQPTPVVQCGVLPC